MRIDFFVLSCGVFILLSSGYFGELVFTPRQQTIILGLGLFLVIYPIFIIKTDIKRRSMKKEILLEMMASILQEIYDEGYGFEFRPAMQNVLVAYKNRELNNRTENNSPTGFEDEEFDALLDSDIDGK